MIEPGSSGEGLRRAAEQADVGEPPAPGVRLRALKRVALRLARIVTHQQVLYNQAMVQAVGELSDRVEQLATETASRLDLGARHGYADVHEAIAAVRSELVAQQLDALSVGAGAAVHGGPSANAAGESSAAAAASLGVDIVGDWAATTGLAEAARRLLSALHEQKVELSVSTARSGAPQDERRIPAAVRELPSGRSHRVELWTLNVNEFPMISDELLRPPGRDSYVIGVWYWELPTFPERLVGHMQRVDEIWVASSFVQGSFRRATDRPVHLVPAVVAEPKGTGRTRQDFGLAADDVVFVFGFDVNSSVARKNPGAVVEAFALAFPAGTCGVQLVVKVLNLDQHPDVAAWLRPAVAAVGGMLIEEDLEHGEVIDLLACSDVYVSLHRSEGFGLGMAEAMSLGKPVVATAYSGNLDFTLPTNSCQVGYRLRPITSEDHRHNAGIEGVYEAGAFWAEPDVAQAARWMQLLAADAGLRARIGGAGMATIRERYSPRVAVDAALRRLALLGDTTR